ncbi:MAG TPA: hypothetical protein DGZ34_08945, partial [Lachnospiraceae bacterium]|nr:hypothetical protein [Lachnospiraceae bacterium]
TNVRVNAIVGGRASTASVATLAKNGVGLPGFPCRAASKSGGVPHRKNRAFRLTAETLCFVFWDSPKPLYIRKPHCCNAPQLDSILDCTDIWYLF